MRRRPRGARWQLSMRQGAEMRNLSFLPPTRVLFTSQVKLDLGGWERERVPWQCPNTQERSPSLVQPVSFTITRLHPHKGAGVR